MNRLRWLLYWVLGIEVVIVAAVALSSLTAKEAAGLCLVILLAAFGAFLGTVAKWFVDDWRSERERADAIWRIYHGT